MTTALASYQNQYVAKKALFSFMGSTFRIFGTDGSLQFMIKQKAFKLKEEINVFADEAQTQKRLTIKARGISDFGGAYDIVDAVTGETVGAAKRAGLKSLFKDEWSLLDNNNQEIGKIQETGGIMILVRKFFKMIQQTYQVTMDGQVEGVIKQKFNPFQLGYNVDFTPGPGKLDPRFGVGITVLLLAIESKNK